jgi:transcriptional regulator with XRE-family HTH domain
MCLCVLRGERLWFLAIGQYQFLPIYRYIIDLLTLYMGIIGDVSKSSMSLKALPAIVSDQLHKLGRDLSLARKRRRMSLSKMAERMMVNIKTVQRMEKGDASVGLGIVATALWILGMDRRLGNLVSPETDQIGLQEDISRLPRDFRRSRKRSDELDF